MSSYTKVSASIPSQWVKALGLDDEPLCSRTEVEELRDRLTASGDAPQVLAVAEKAIDQFEASDATLLPVIDDHTRQTSIERFAGQPREVVKALAVAPESRLLEMVGAQPVPAVLAKDFLRDHASLQEVLEVHELTEAFLDPLQGRPPWDGLADVLVDRMLKNPEAELVVGNEMLGGTLAPSLLARAVVRRLTGSSDSEFVRIGDGKTLRGFSRCLEAALTNESQLPRDQDMRAWSAPLVQALAAIGGARNQRTLENLFHSADVVWHDKSFYGACAAAAASARPLSVDVVSKLRRDVHAAVFPHESAPVDHLDFAGTRGASLARSIAGQHASTLVRSLRILAEGDDSTRSFRQQLACELLDKLLLGETDGSRGLASVSVGNLRVREHIWSDQPTYAVEVAHAYLVAGAPSKALTFVKHPLLREPEGDTLPVFQIAKTLRFLREYLGFEALSVEERDSLASRLRDRDVQGLAPADRSEFDQWGLLHGR